MIEKRKRAGNNILTTVVPGDSKMGKYFFTLRIKGEPVKITEQAKMAKLREEGKLDAQGNVIYKAKPCEIESSLDSRVKDSGEAASILHVVKDGSEKKGVEGQAFKLQLKGGQPKLAEASPDMGDQQAAAVGN